MINLVSKWVPRICSREHLMPFKNLAFGSLRCKEVFFINCELPISAKDRILSSKYLCFHSIKRASITEWAPCISLKGQVFASNYHNRATFVRWISHNFVNNRVFSSKHGGSRIKIPVLGNTRGFSSVGAAPNDPKPAFRGHRIISQAQEALMDYLHFTTGLEFSDAEHMSKNSPSFLNKILDKVEKEGEDIERALTRFFRYHPPNEVEIFFESMGLKPSDFNSLLPRDLFYLKDDLELLDNYHVLCNYGIDRSEIGRIYKKAADVFKYECGVLGSKLRAYEELGLRKSNVIKLVVSNPPLLIGDVNKEFAKVLEGLEDLGLERNWIGDVLSEKDFYSWSRMLIVLQSCFEMGFTKQELEALIREHPDFLLDGSGRTLFSLIGFQLKLGATRKEIFSLLLNFPQVQVGKFMKNLRQGLVFLVELQMDPEDIKMLLCTHKEMFGKHTLKKASSVVSLLQTSSKRLCTIIKDDPHQLKNYVKGSKLSALPCTRDDELCHMQRRKFLLCLGFVDNSKDMEKAMTYLRGKSDELQGRYDLLVKFGLKKDDVYTMIKKSPIVLNQTVDVLEKKINFLVKELGYPLSTLVEFPKILAYTIERVKLRLSMYTWLRDRGKASPTLALSSILSCSDEKFRKWLISGHPQGPKVWEEFKAELYSK
ncbi:uncharacterized protein A4U43_C09F3910 [Asparagus officinalis]|uniref:Uncharacterized protein n=1 Tax=Asparagus officinalis TaxID=4686 RepID=A0A5P1E5E2_ASPOF|nr:transcription termination factor MTEF18, mitochondrial-like [Asparagus officinalis]XP_020244968.1 transcription termination factor MTEF18, mitochondrial-like [Asparagus officinalis]XP_020244969.1 transcription termination factor MTEF18, mitochondrial-like [Asparagus officinalis]ONK57770.1 uncharacterized protein A4U43_C09F3910 [Asparagus officinalis]